MIETVDWKTIEDNYPPVNYTMIDVFARRKGLKHAYRRFIDIFYDAKAETLDLRFGIPEEYEVLAWRAVPNPLHFANKLLQQGGKKDART